MHTAVLTCVHDDAPVESAQQIVRRGDLARPACQASTGQPKIGILHDKLAYRCRKSAGASLDMGKTDLIAAVIKGRAQQPSIAVEWSSIERFKLFKQITDRPWWFHFDDDIPTVPSSGKYIVHLIYHKISGKYSLPTWFENNQISTGPRRSERVSSLHVRNLRLLFPRPGTV